MDAVHAKCKGEGEMTYKEFASQINIKVDNPPNDCDMSREITIEDCIYLFNSLGRQIRYLQERSNWHTGTPTEEGWYLMKVKLDDEIIYDTNYLTPCVYGMDWRYAHEEIIEWQKIEEKKDGIQTDL